MSLGFTWAVNRCGLVWRERVNQTAQGTRPSDYFVAAPPMKRCRVDTASP